MNNIRQYILENDPVKKKTVFNGIPISLEWLDGEVRTYPGSPYKNPLKGFHYGGVSEISWKNFVKEIVKSKE